LIAVRSPDEIQRIRASCEIVFAVQRELEQAVQVDISTGELDALAERTIRAHGARPAFKGYRDFPSSICTSINSAAVHGFPSADVLLSEGDIISIDVGVELDGYYGDGAFTVGVGVISADCGRLLETTLSALHDGIAQAQAGGRLTDISHAIQSRVEDAGMSVIRQFGGHGIGRTLHEEPHIPNHGGPGKGPRLKPGYVFAIEPIVSLGGADLVVGDDGWTTTTRDSTAVAHAEHTVALTAEGPEILTLPEASAS
jgi:methionyl aminopeptidase